jgi:hypothetical protein
LQGEQREFLAYGLLYAAATGRDVLAYEMSEAFGGSSSARSSSSSGGGGGGLAGDRFVGHALAVCRAYLGGDFVEFLRLYEAAPRMAPYLQDLLLAKLRGRAYREWRMDRWMDCGWIVQTGLWIVCSLGQAVQGPGCARFDAC